MEEEPFGRIILINSMYNIFQGQKTFLYILLHKIESVIALLTRFTSKKKKYELVIVKTDHIGDGIKFLSVFENFKTKRSNSLFICSSNSEAVLNEMFTGLNFYKIDISKYRKSVFYRLHIMFSLASISCTQLIMPIKERDWLSSVSIANAIKAKKKYALNKRHDMNRAQLHKYESKLFTYVEANFLSEDLSFETFLSKIFAKRRMSKSPERNKGYKAGLTLVCPFTTDSARDMPMGFLEKIISHLNGYYDTTPVLVGNRIYSKIFFNNINLRFENRLNKTNSNEFVRLIRDSSILITAESAPFHVAMYYNRPTILLAGGGHFGRFFSPKSKNILLLSALDHSCFNCNWKCTRNNEASSGHYPCIQEIDFDASIEKINRFIKKHI